MQSVYIETTIPSYLISRKSKQASLAADQEATRDWSEEQRFHFRVFTSFYTIDECCRGNPDLAAKRLSKLKGIPELELVDTLPDLQEDLIRLFHLPPEAVTDASHLGLAILHRMDYLLTWNCTHLANAVLQKELLDYCSYYGLHVPIICTPRTLIELNHD
jgi:hypothetical protein